MCNFIIFNEDFFNILDEKRILKWIGYLIYPIAIPGSLNIWKNVSISTKDTMRRLTTRASREFQIKIKGGQINGQCISILLKDWTNYRGLLGES